MFQGSDTDALHQAGQECAEGAKVTDEIIMVVKLLIIALLAASWFTGGASATYAETLQTKVLPWLQKISQALHLFSQVLAGQADAQDKASAGESVDFGALPTYTSPWSPDAAVAAVVGGVTGATTPAISTTPTGTTVTPTTGTDPSASTEGSLLSGTAGSTGALGGAAGSLGAGLSTTGALTGSTFGGSSTGTDAALGTSGVLSAGSGSGGSTGGSGSLGSDLAGSGLAGSTGTGSTFGTGTDLSGGTTLPTAATGDTTSFPTASATPGASGTGGAVTTTPNGDPGGSGLAGSLGAAGAAGALGLGGAAAMAGRTAGQGSGTTSPDGFDYNRIKGVTGNANVTPEFLRKVEGIADRLGTKPENLMAAMSFETGGSFDPAQKNLAGGSARGLIQFMPDTARGLHTTSEALVAMTPVQQLDYVERYFAGSTGKVGTVEGLYSKILAGHAVPNPDDVLFAAGTKKYRSNAGLDVDGVGGITAGEAARAVRARILPEK